MKVLVTGASGLIGSHLSEELKKRDYDVYCLVRKTSHLRYLEGKDLKYIYGDCLDKSSLIENIRGFDYIFHLAGLTKAKREEDYFFVNTMGTKNLLEVIEKNNPEIRRFVLLSSLAAAGPCKDGTPKNEDSEACPVSPYGRSKLEAEYAVHEYKGRIPFTIIRPPAVYGPRDRDMFVLFKMVNMGICLSPGMSYFSFIYVEDLVKGIILSATSERAVNKIYFLSDGEVSSTDNIIDAISESLKKRPIRLRVPASLAPFIAKFTTKFAKNSIIDSRLKELQYKYWICDITKARLELGYHPKVSLKEGIRWTANWYRIHRWL